MTETNKESQPFAPFDNPAADAFDPLGEQSLDDDLEEIVIPELDETLLADDPAQPGEESKARRFFRKLFRWTAGILVVFALGFLLAVLLLYQPTRTQLNRAEGDLSQLDQQIADLNSQISDLDAEIAGQANTIGNLRIENEELLAGQGGFALQIAVLNARIDVANATLALQNEEEAKAQLILTGTGETLETIRLLLPADQQAVIDPLIQRLELVQTEAIEDLFAALSDLSVLEAQLLQLESDLFD